MAQSNTKTKTAAFKKSLGSAWNKTKQKASETTTNFKERMTMEGLLGQALISLKYHLDAKTIVAEQRMSRDVLRKAMGIVFITEAKGGFLFGVKGGSGVIMIRKPVSLSSRNHSQKTHYWSSPCAVGTGGLSVGLLVGAAKVDHIIILSSQDQIDTFLSNGQLQIAGNANATGGKWGRNVESGMAVGSNKQSSTGQNTVAPISTYSFGNKGIYGGISLDGQILSVRKNCNEAFYGKKVDVKEILNGQIAMPGFNGDYDELLKLLNAYCMESNDEQKQNTMASSSSKGNPGNRNMRGGGKGSSSKGYGQKQGNYNAQQNMGAQGGYSGNNKQGQTSYNIPQNQYIENNATNQAALQSMAQNKEVQNAGREAMKDKQIRNAAFNAYKSGGNDNNANKELAKSLAKNKAVQGAAVSVAKDEKVQKAAWQTSKKHATKDNFGKMKNMMFSKK